MRLGGPVAPRSPSSSQANRARRARKKARTEGAGSIPVSLKVWRRARIGIAEWRPVRSERARSPTLVNSISRAAGRNPLAGEVAVIVSTTRENFLNFRRTRTEATNCPDTSAARPRCPNRPLLAQGVVLGSFGVLLPISKRVPNRSEPSPTRHETVETLVALGLYGDKEQATVARLAARSRPIPGKTFQIGPQPVEYLPAIGPLTTFGAGLGPRSWPRLLWLTGVSFWARLSRSTSPPRPG